MRSLPVDSPPATPSSPPLVDIPASGDADLYARVRRLKRETRMAIGIAALAASLTLLGGLEAQREIQEARGDVQKQTAELDASSRQARALAAQAEAASHDLEGRMAAFEARLADAQGQQVALEALYHDLTVNQEDTALAEVEQAVAIANQELLLAGDVRLAIRAMENASKRLERIDRPSLLGLRHILDEDLRRLRNIPLVDISGMSVRLDTLASSSDTLPLAAEARPAAPARPAVPPASGIWGRLGEQLLAELGQAVRIQRIEQSDKPPLLPDQSFFLRQNLKLRLLTARQALLAHDENTFRNDLRQAARWLDIWYDRHDRGVEKTAEALHQMIDSPVTITVPDVEASLAAVRDARTLRRVHSK